jgi:predicted ATPase/DNA-binding SARP family transcriptional activator
MVVTRAEGADGALRIDVLGPLRLTVDGDIVEVPGPRRRAVLALLVLAGGRTVSVDALLDAVWPDAAPDSGRRALHSHISRLRGHLGRHGDALERDGAGYRLRSDLVVVDLAEVRDTITRARAELAGAPDRAAQLLGVALEHWRGDALDEFDDVASLAADAVAIATLRDDTHDEWCEARLAAGGDPQLVADLARATAASPQRERTVITLVRALAAEGRQAEALRAAHEFRQRLADETGFDPSPAFTIAEHDAASGVTAAPPRARAAQPTALPPRARPSTPMVGRERELARIRHELSRARLVTIVGPGGVGKTRLALETSADLSSERAVYVVELATIDDERHTLDAFAAALALRAPDHESLRDAAVAVLAAHPATLVVDNCEHLLAASRELVESLLDAVPQLTVLATSREPLDVPSEHLVRLGPLPVPEQDAATPDIAAAPAVEAFVTHVRRRDPDFTLDDASAAVVGDITRRLDGLPLALELAAGRVGTLGLRDVHERLGRALDLLGRGRATNDDRHRTLRSTIEWSYRLLDDDERRLLRALAAFPGGVDLAGIERLAARRLAATDPAATAARLVDASVVVAEPHPAGTRFRLLETVRSFAMDDVESQAEREEVEADLVDTVLSLAQELGALAHGPQEGVANERLRAEFPNVRAARDVLSARGDTAREAELLLELRDLAGYRAYPELHTWMVELGELVAASPSTRDGALVLGGASHAAWLRGELDRAQRFGERAMEVALDERELIGAYNALGVVALFRGEFARALEFHRRAAALSTPAQAVIFYPTAALGPIYAGEHDTARELLAESWELVEVAGSPSDRAFTRYVEGELLATYDLDAAITAYEEAIALARSVGATFAEGVAMVGLVSAWGRCGRLAEALGGYRWLVDYWRRAGNWTQLWTTLRNLARALADADDPQCAAFVLAAASHAEGAASIDAATEAEITRFRAELARRLGDAELQRVEARARALNRATVVEEALEAVDAALR